MAKKSSTQDQLIGKHPSRGVFATWLTFDDLAPSGQRKHRKLAENSLERKNAIPVIADWIIEHHLSDNKIKRFDRKKAILGKHGYIQYLNIQKPLPTFDKTKKGNCAEIILTEYLKASSGLELLLFRLRYNPNVDQSMKGDDVLLFDLKTSQGKIIVGEAKYRGTSNRRVVEDIVNAFEGNKRFPISITFVAAQLGAMGQEDLAEELEELNLEMHKLNVPVINVGLLFSNQNAATHIETHANPKNDKLVMLSLGVDDAEEIITQSFDLAYKRL